MFKVYKINKEFKMTVHGFKGLVTTAELHSKHDSVQKAVAVAKKLGKTGNFRKKGGETFYAYVSEKNYPLLLEQTDIDRPKKVKIAQLAEKLHCQLANRLWEKCDKTKFFFAGQLKTPLLTKLAEIADIRYTF